MAQQPVNGGGPAVLFVHATGMCKETWRPVVDLVAASGTAMDATLVDQRGHGASGSFPHPLDWWQVGEDILAVVGAGRGMIGVGHSSGGTALLLAESLRPGTFRSLVLIEPIVAMSPFRRNDQEPLAVAARRRTRGFPSRAEAAKRFRARGPFAGWDEHAFAGYLEGGLEPDPPRGDTAVRLACRPEDEAEFFASLSAPDLWVRLSDISCPIELIAGEDSASHSPRYLSRLADRLPRATVTWVPAADHFVTMQRPDIVAAAVSEAVTGDWSA